MQKRFMKWFNKERTNTLLTFPVETIALLTDEKGEPKDPEWGDFTAEMYSEGHLPEQIADVGVACTVIVNSDIDVKPLVI